MLWHRLIPCVRLCVYFWARSPQTDHHRLVLAHLNITVGLVFRQQQRFDEARQALEEAKSLALSADPKNVNGTGQALHALHGLGGLCSLTQDIGLRVEAD